MGLWSDIVRRGTTGEVRKEDKFEHMNEIEKALAERGKKLPHKGQFFINNVGTLIEILGSSEDLTITPQYDRLVLTIEYAVWNEEITDHWDDEVNVLIDADDVFDCFEEDIKIKFEEGYEEYGDDILSEYNQEWNKCYLPILKEFLKTKTWTDRCGDIYGELWCNGDLREEILAYLNDYLMCKYFDYDVVDWDEDGCFWDGENNYWDGCNAAEIFKDIEY